MIAHPAAHLYTGFPTSGEVFWGRRPPEWERSRLGCCRSTVAGGSAMPRRLGRRVLDSFYDRDCASVIDFAQSNSDENTDTHADTRSLLFLVFVPREGLTPDFPGSGDSVPKRSKGRRFRKEDGRS